MLFMIVMMPRYYLYQLLDIYRDHIERFYTLKSPLVGLRLEEIQFDCFQATMKEFKTKRNVYGVISSRGRGRSEAGIR